MADPVRYTDLKFPPYAYQPGGSFPHPTRHPDGHSFSSPREAGAGTEPVGGAQATASAAASGGAAEVATSTLTMQGWRQCQPYLYGVDLFNAGFLWEAHEAWEEPWARAEPASAERELLQGLIQVAAALIKHRGGAAEPAARLFLRGREHLSSGEPKHFGIDPDQVLGAVDAYLAGRSGASPRIVLDI